MHGTSARTAFWTHSMGTRLASEDGGPPEVGRHLPHTLPGAGTGLGNWVFGSRALRLLSEPRGAGAVWVCAAPSRLGLCGTWRSLCSERCWEGRKALEATAKSGWRTYGVSPTPEAPRPAGLGPPRLSRFIGLCSAPVGSEPKSSFSRLALAQPRPPELTCLLLLPGDGPTGT